MPALLFAALLSFAPRFAAAAVPAVTAAPVDEARGAAEAVLQTEKARSGYRRLPPDAVLGAALDELLIPVDEVSRYTGAEDPASVLHPMGRRSYIVTSQGRPRALIALRKESDRWLPAVVFPRGFAEAVQERLDSLPAAQQPVILWYVGYAEESFVGAVDGQGRLRVAAWNGSSVSGGVDVKDLLVSLAADAKKRLALPAR